MDQSEYDRLYRRRGIMLGVGEQDEQGQTEVIVDGRSVAPLRITLVNSTPEEMRIRDEEEIQGRVEVVGMIGDGVELIRRTGGADYAGNEQWRMLMRRFGRLR